MGNVESAFAAGNGDGQSGIGGTTGARDGRFTFRMCQAPSPSSSPLRG